MSGDTTAINAAMVGHLAGKFTDHSDELGPKVTSFAGSTGQIGEAFGVLGACDGATEQYTNLTSETVTGLNQLMATLAGISSGLNQTAAAFQGGDQQVSTGITDSGTGSYRVNI